MKSVWFVSILYDQHTIHMKCILNSKASMAFLSMMTNACNVQISQQMLVGQAYR
jgi:hypothetical protein